MAKINEKEVFDALPHVDEIWITNDAFHLDGSRGGKKVVREGVKGVADPILKDNINDVQQKIADIAAIKAAETTEEAMTLAEGKGDDYVNAAKERVAELKANAKPKK